ncbi:nucleoside recognition domain-containing protein [uncultured Desulfobacter sp.]|uniref:nucleoside recognition domain-containing protein n=1 Tax=uncultured Desulfobacter sp. TaxID=240139 RepID=UPI002AA72203|nr:nucleoside recognition domain-containing protein [uncultured Desulfobacter sp.]
MEILLSSMMFTLDLVFRMGSVMFISLFGVELFMQMGLMRYLEPVGKPVARAARLPAETAFCFLAAIGSMIAAHTMAAQFHADKRLDDRELRLTGILNTVPFHLKETLTFQLPIVLPLLGGRLAMIYITAFWLTGVLKFCYVLVRGRAWGNGRELSENGEDPFSAYECTPDDPNCLHRSFTRLLKDAWDARKKMFFKMIGVLAVVTLLVQVLTESGMLSWVETGIAPLTSVLGLSPAVIGPLTTYIFSPVAGISYMSTLLTQNSITGYEAITALIAGGLLMIPVTRLRRTLPRYIAIYGGRNGSVICVLTMVFGLLSRILVLGWILIFY